MLLKITPLKNTSDRFYPQALIFFQNFNCYSVQSVHFSQVSQTQPPMYALTRTHFHILKSLENVINTPRDALKRDAKICFYLIPPGLPTLSLYTQQSLKINDLL